MEIAVLVFGIVGFIMSPLIVGAAPAAFGILLGIFRLLNRKKHLKALGKIEITAGIVFGVLAILVSAYVYTAGVMNIDYRGFFSRMITEIKLKF